MTTTATIDTSELEVLMRRLPKAFEVASRDVVEETMEAGAKRQVETYTANSRPKQPEGTPYKRTFDLQRTSKQRLISSSKTQVKGEWSVGGGMDVDYAPFVVGTESQQAGIHKGRWHSADDSADFMERDGTRRMVKAASKVITRINQ